MFALGLAIGVVLAVGALLYFQIRSIWRNQTGIEDWIIEKADYRRKDTKEKFEHPYNLGRWKNLRQVITATCLPYGDGIDWQLRDGAHKYALTIEQLEQKAEKRLRTREYKIMRPYSGSWCPLWNQGFKVACHPPCTDEPRISLFKGDLVKVTRWKRHWLYGDKVPKEINGRGDTRLPSQKLTCDDNHSKFPPGKEIRSRGWFPRKCAAELVTEEEYYDHCEMKKSRPQRHKDNPSVKSNTTLETKKHQ